ncbi:MAG: sugar phosphate isomerase/epimerase family protein [Acutalibacteraceae bacterium]|nr:sugar phosphate isomerase/epimerase family protein [Acutalibacteraceae bacterium]
MLVSTNTGALCRTFTLKEALSILKDAGFDAFDLSLDGGNGTPKAPFDGDDWREVAKEIREYADSIGLPCNQSHAVFGSHLGAAKPDTPLFEGTVRCMEIAAIMGAKAIVVHPMQYLYYMNNVEFLKQENIEFYRNLLPYAEKFGIVMLTENMWQKNPNNGCIIQSTCAEAGEFAEYVDMINSPYLKACLDIGHTVLTGESITNMCRTLGKERIVGLHIHDVDGANDNHTLPYTLKANFEEMIDALAEIGYEGDITFEVGSFVVDMPRELQPSAMRLMADMGHYFVRSIKAKSAE